MNKNLLSIPLWYDVRVLNSFGGAHSSISHSHTEAPRQQNMHQFNLYSHGNVKVGHLFWTLLKTQKKSNLQNNTCVIEVQGCGV